MSFRLGQVASGDLVGVLPSTVAGPLAAARTAIKGIVANGHLKVLVVGTRGDNFTPDYRAHPQLVFCDQPRDRMPDLPQAVRLVLFTRFVGHNHYDALRARCREADIPMVPHPLGTGQIRELLEPFFQAQQAPVAAPEREATVSNGEVTKSAPAAPSPQLARFERGGLKQFVAQHGNIDAVPRSSEAERLLRLAEREGYTSTVGSIVQTMNQLRDERHSNVTVDVKEEPAAVIAPVVAEPKAPLDDEDAELLRMMDDIIAAVTLLRQTLISRSESVRQMRALRDMIGKMKL